MRSWTTLLLCSTACALVACASTPTSSRYTRNAVAPPSATQTCSESAPSQTWAVVVGINFYEDDRIPDLGGAVNDAWTYYHYLASPTGGGVDAYRLRLLLNDEATRTNVEGALGGFLAGACPQDKVIIYFAGHGAPEPGRPEEAFLLVHDTDVDNLVGSAVSMSRLPDFLAWRAGRAGSLLLLVDACHSGNIQFPGDRGFVPKTVNLERASSVAGSLDTLATRDGWGAISATGPDQLAGESSASCKLGGQDYAGGIFTCNLVSGLSGAADSDADGTVVLDELFAHVERTVSNASGGQQRPRRSGTLAGTLAMSQSGSLDVEIPRVPERFLVDASPHPLRPWIWTGAALSAGTLVTAGVFNLLANSSAGDANAVPAGGQSRADYQDRVDDHARDVTLANTTYVVGAALALGTGLLLAWDIFGEAEDADDVYGEDPWFRVGVGELTLGFRW